MTKLTMRERLLLGVLALLLLATGYYYFVVTPYLTKQATLTAANAQLELDIARMSKLESEREAIAAEIESLKLSLMENKEKATLTEALLYLESNAAAAKVTLRDLSLGSVGETGGQFTLTMSGTYSAVHTYLQALETPQWVTIALTHLSGGSGTEISVVVTANLFSGTITPIQRTGGNRQSPFAP